MCSSSMALCNAFVLPLTVCRRRQLHSPQKLRLLIHRNNLVIIQTVCRNNERAKVVSCSVTPEPLQPSQPLKPLTPLQLPEPLQPLQPLQSAQPLQAPQPLQLAQLPQPLHQQRRTLGPSKPFTEKVRKLSSVFVNLFPIYAVVASALALYKPAFFAATTSTWVMQSFLSLLMLSTGLTLSLRDILDSFKKPLPVLFNFFVCFIAIPYVALGLSVLFNLQGTVRAGLLLLAIVSGGQASNLCTHIAGGDTALSVTMTTSTTLSASLMLPVLSSFFLGTVVSVNRLQMALTTAQVTLLPILVGALANQLFPRKIASVRSLLPVIGIIAVLVLVLGPVAQTSSIFAQAWSTLLVPVLLLHILGGAIGFIGPSTVNAGWKMSITTAFETSFKSPVLSYLLAKRLFPPGVELASAVSVVLLLPVASLFAVLLKELNQQKSKS